MDNNLPLEKPDYTGERVRLCEDGKYRWTYSMNMYTNPAIINVVFKIFGILFAIAILAMFIGPAIRGEWDVVKEGLRIWLIVLGVFAVLVVLAYLIVAWTYGGRYIVHFTMDDKLVIHEQEAAQVARARKLNMLTVLVGVLAKRPSTVGAGMLAASRSTSSSVLENVRRIKPRRRLHLIKVNQLLDRNQVYVPDEDFDFVLDFLRTHCPNAK